MITKDLNTLDIHKLSKEQYERELAAGTIDENALYITPYDDGTAVGKSLEGLVVSPSLNQSVTAGTGAEIFNDYNEREYDSDGDYLNGNIASGNYSHAEGRGTTASGEAAHAEGGITVASGLGSHAEGGYTTASSNFAHAEGSYTVASGLVSHAEGSNTNALGAGAHAEGDSTTASGSYSHAEGGYTMTTSNTSLKPSTPIETNAGEYTHAEGVGSIASGAAAHAEGAITLASGQYSHAEGTSTISSGYGSHAEGGYTCTGTATVTVPNLVSYDSGDYAHAEGYGTIASGAFSHAENGYTTASGNWSHAEGTYTTASGDCSHAAGRSTTALNNQYVIGHYNANGTAGASTGTTGDAFIIGKGSAGSLSRAFRVTYAGRPYSCSSMTTTGADYAEFFEWQDLNLNNEDRRGYFVTLDGEQIKIAEPNDYILGIVSALPAMIGNGDEDWKGRYILDDFGAFINEEFEYEEEVIDNETGEKRTVTKIGTRYKENPDYDPSQPYIQREDRPEWDAVGLVGVLAVRDDGTCQVNGFCKVAEGGIATTSDSGYRVIKRVNENIVKVVFR